MTKTLFHLPRGEKPLPLCELTSFEDYRLFVRFRSGNELDLASRPTLLVKRTRRLDGPEEWWELSATPTAPVWTFRRNAGRFVYRAKWLRPRPDLETPEATPAPALALPAVQPTLA